MTEQSYGPIPLTARLFSVLPLKIIVSTQKCEKKSPSQPMRISPRGRTIHECRREAFETEARRSLSQVRPTEAYAQSVEEAKREKPRQARGSDDAAGIHE